MKKNDLNKNLLVREENKRTAKKHVIDCFIFIKCFQSFKSSVENLFDVN